MGRRVAPRLTSDSHPFRPCCSYFTVREHSPHSSPGGGLCIEQSKTTASSSLRSIFSMAEHPRITGEGGQNIRADVETARPGRGRDLTIALGDGPGARGPGGPGMTGSQKRLAATPPRTDLDPGPFLMPVKPPAGSPPPVPVMPVPAAAHTAPRAVRSLLLCPHDPQPHGPPGAG